MRCLSYKESADWCRQYGFPVVDVGHYGRPAPAVGERFRLIELPYSADSGLRVSLARDVMEWVARSSAPEMLLWVGEWAVWPGSQHLPLFTRFREAFGETRPLIQAPGHLFRTDETDDALSVLIVSLLFFWDCHVFPSGPGAVFFCCHDEWNGFYLPPGYDETLITARFSGWFDLQEEPP